MYKLLIADDENLIRKGIIAKLQHYNFKFAKILEAVDGEEAYKIIQDEQPEIVITDIRMPFQDGIELIRKTKEFNDRIQFIIISGFAEFAYAEQALNMGVSGYILKPINDKDLINNLNKVILQLDEKNHVQSIINKQTVLEKECEELITEQKLNQIFHSINKNKEEVSNIEIPEGLKNKKYALAILNIDGSNYYHSDFNFQDLELVKFSIRNIMNEIEMPCQKVIINNQKDKNQLLILMTGLEKLYLKHHALKYMMDSYNKIGKYLDLSITIGMSYVNHQLSNKVLKQATEAFDLRLIHGSNDIYTYDYKQNSKDFNIPKNSIELLRKYLERLDVKNIELILKDIFAPHHFKKASGKHIRLTWIEVINVIIKVCSDLGYDMSHTLNDSLLSEEILDRFESREEIIIYLYTTIINIFKLEKKDVLSTVNKIRLAMKYIQAHFYEDIIVNELAYMFAMNPNYFSKVFKKEMGTTVINYISDLRIKNACELLKETNASIIEIAKSVGYQDNQYFYRVFKKKTGRTPLAYRKMVN